MLFNSIHFLLFFIIVYAIYRSINHRFQNYLLLISGYYFYGVWDWRFLGLLFLSTLLDYSLGRFIFSRKNQKQRKFALALSIFCNLSFLGFFKYYNFFADNFRLLALTLGWHPDLITLKIILPIGISFYTFVSMSYTFDIYRNKIEPTRNFFDYACFVAYFPQLLAGPIERARRLLPQIVNPRQIKIADIKVGLWLFFWGLFKKSFMADNLAHLVDAVFSSNGASGGEILISIYGFAFQIYGDFSGYSDMARGVSKLLGIELIENFRFPYFVTNPRDFWKNWHISLSTWLRDYLYIPLGGNRGGRFFIFRNLFLTMVLGGLWHGAAWTYVFWGAYHGTILIVHRLIEPYGPIISFKNRLAGKIWVLIKIIFMFHLTCLGWLFFRSQSVKQIIFMLHKIITDFSANLFGTIMMLQEIIFYILLVLIILLFENAGKFSPAVLHLPSSLKFSIWIFMFYLMMFWGDFGGKQFIYFQF